MALAKTSTNAGSLGYLQVQSKAFMQTAFRRAFIRLDEMFARGFKTRWIRTIKWRPGLVVVNFFHIMPAPTEETVSAEPKQAERLWPHYKFHLSATVLWSGTFLLSQRHACRTTHTGHSLHFLLLNTPEPTCWRYSGSTAGLLEHKNAPLRGSVMTITHVQHLLKAKACICDGSLL